MATGLYETFDSNKQFNANMEANTISKHRSASIFNNPSFQQYEEEDLNFRDSDTIAMIELVEYNQN